MHHSEELKTVRALSGPALAKKAQWLLRKSRGEGFLSKLFGG